MKRFRSWITKLKNRLFIRKQLKQASYAADYISSVYKVLSKLANGVAIQLRHSETLQDSISTAVISNKEDLKTAADAAEAIFNGIKTLSVVVPKLLDNKDVQAIGNTFKTIMESDAEHFQDGIEEAIETVEKRFNL